jgi:hypothetical protein
MILVIRLLRYVAYLIGITGALIKLNSTDRNWQMLGIVLAGIGFLMIVAAYVVTAIVAARQKTTRRRR